MLKRCDSNTAARASSGQQDDTVEFDEGLVNPEFFDPITLRVMAYPVVTKHGLTFDRYTLLEALKRDGRCPVTRNPLSPHTTLAPNKALKELIAADPHARHFAELSKKAYEKDVALALVLNRSLPDDELHELLRRDDGTLVATILEKTLQSFRTSKEPCGNFSDMVNYAKKMPNIDWNVALAALRLDRLPKPGGRLSRGANRLTLQWEKARGQKDAFVMSQVLRRWAEDIGFAPDNAENPQLVAGVEFTKNLLMGYYSAFLDAGLMGETRLLKLCLSHKAFGVYLPYR